MIGSCGQTATKMSTTPAEAGRGHYPRRSRGAATGFTLLEVMVALLVVAFAFVSLLTLHGRNIKAISRTQDLTRATLLARDIVSQIEVEVETGGFQQLGDSQGTFPDHPGFRWEREVHSTPLDELREVLVRVIWDERNPRGCELVFFVRDPGV
jgi:type II secretion system protein I